MNDEQMSATKFQIFSSCNFGRSLHSFHNLENVVSLLYFPPPLPSPGFKLSKSSMTFNFISSAYMLLFQITQRHLPEF